MSQRHNHSELESIKIDMKGRPVGSEDFETASLMLKFCENEGFRGTSLRIAANVAEGLMVAVELSNRGHHDEAGKQAGNVLWVLRKDRENSLARNYRALGSMVIPCRDGYERQLGSMVKWYMETHTRMHEQILTARAIEAAELEQSELEALQFAESLAAGKAASEPRASAVKAA